MRIEELRRQTKEFKRPLKATVDEIVYTSGQYTVKLLLPDHMFDDLEQFGCLEALETLPFERFNLHIKRACRTTSERRSSVLLETDDVMDTIMQEDLRRTDSM